MGRNYVMNNPCTENCRGEKMCSKEDKLAFEFFQKYAKLECALKRAGYLKKGGNVQADWTGFTQKIKFSIDDICDRVHYILKHPPKKQIRKYNTLEWEEDEEKDLIKLTQRIRNNLFHGGKYSGSPGSRNAKILEAGIVILDYVIEKSDKTIKSYFQEASL
ncbi:MAG: hypothetical protein SFT81_07960 [Candidatus Caenarcaniphilales bacterium]|nr:hypothetical protein [Candidatus Caenarcaniphilales bacterium]